MTSSVTTDSLTALRALLAKADDLGSLREVAERLVPERRHALLRRSAIPVVFDEPMVRAVLLPRLPAPSDGSPADEDADVAWLLAHSDIERLGGAEVLYRMRADVRGARLERWFAPNDRARAYEDAVDGIALSEAIVAHLSTPTGVAKPGWQAERLYHLALADPDAAAHELDTAYRQADEDFDVPVCYRILQAIGGQRALLGRHRDQRDQPTDRSQAITRLIEKHDALQQYYEARSAFSVDLAKSAHALEREFMRAEWDRIARINTTSGSSLNTPEREWIIDLTAQGGLDAFWQNPIPPDPETFAAFRRVLIERCLIPGGFFSKEALDKVVRHAIARFEGMPLPPEEPAGRRPTACCRCAWAP